MNEKWQQLKDWIEESKQIVFFGGAGVSTESGIPDFRSENGIFMTINEYAKPNNAHKALAKLEKEGKLRSVITQNIDDLHQKAGSQRVLELHGTLYKNYCMKCGKTFDLSYVMQNNGITKCDACGGIVRPDVVLYEEGLDNTTVTEAVKDISNADMLIVGGTSLNVYPAAGLIRYYKGNKLVLINKSATQYDKSADLVISDAIGDVLGSIVL